MAAHNWPLDAFGEIDEHAAKWGDECHGPQCSNCHDVVCVVHAEDEEALADKIFADCREAAA